MSSDVLVEGELDSAIRASTAMAFACVRYFIVGVGTENAPSNLPKVPKLLLSLDGTRLCRLNFIAETKHCPISEFLF